MMGLGLEGVYHRDGELGNQEGARSARPLAGCEYPQLEKIEEKRPLG